MTMSTNLGDMRRRARPIKAYHSGAPAVFISKRLRISSINSGLCGERRGTLGILWVLPIKDSETSILSIPNAPSTIEATGWVIKYPEKRRRIEATGKTTILATRLVIQPLKASFLPGIIPLRRMRGERIKYINIVT